MEAALPAVLEALERAAAQACRRHVPPAPPTPWPATRDPNVLALARPWLSRRNAKASVVHGGLDERRPPPAVEPYEVPILLARPRDLLRLSSHRYGDDAWDLAVQQVIPHVDGVRSAKQLARAARVDLDVVLRSLRVLRHYRCLAVVDTFQAPRNVRSNAYSPYNKADVLSKWLQYSGPDADVIVLIDPDNWLLKDLSPLVDKVQPGAGRA